MRTTRTAAAASLVVGGLLSVALATPAAAVCDAYSNGCVEPPTVLPTTQTRTPQTTTTTTARVAPTVSTPSTLPFTGGELVLVSVVGAAAVAGGTALVVAGRRRSQPDS